MVTKPRMEAEIKGVDDRVGGIFRPRPFYLVWSQYAQANYTQSRRFCWRPVWIIGAVLISFAIMDAVEGLFK